MRFEGKHNYFKDLAHRIKSFKNVPKTMATRHQLLMCYYRSSSVDSSIFYKDTNSGPETKSTVGSLQYKDEILNYFPSLLNCDEIRRIKWVEIYGTTYKKGGVVVLDMNLLPEFGVITDIIVFNTDEFYLVCDVLFTHNFHHHLHCYLVSYDNSKNIFAIVKQKDLYDHSSLSIYERANSFYIPLKYQLIDKIQ
jgi:hypothetical protein